MGSFRRFLAGYVFIRDGGGTKLIPWGWQLLYADVIERECRTITLKARQMGVSWILAAYALHTALREKGAVCLLLSQTQRPDAEELYQKVEFIYDHLPPWMQQPTVKRNMLGMEFEGTYSQIMVRASTEKAGRGFKVRLVVADEHAFHQWAAKNMAALLPTMEDGGQFHSVSTANGLGDPFSSLWSRSQSGASGWHGIFLPYDLRPGRDAAWYELQRDSYPQEWMIHQEYPRNPEEAFVQTSRPVFLREYLDELKQGFRESLARTLIPGFIADMPEDELRCYAVPVNGHRYVAGADVAEGLAHGDYSDLSVWDVDTDGSPQEALSLHGHWSPDVFGKRIDAVARVYRGLYGIERNNHGLATILECQRLGTPGLYKERPVLSRNGEQPGLTGWHTNTATKPLMIDELAVAMRPGAGQWRFSDELMLPEFSFYRTFDNGSTGAPEGQWDDRVISRSIAVQMRKYIPSRVIEDTERGKAPGPALTGTGFRL